MSKPLQVQGTNDYSIVSKYSMVRAGYFKDDFIQYFVKKYSRRSPLINLGYCVRARIIDYTLRTFLKHVQQEQSQIISCGAGFDTSFFRLSHADVLRSNVRYYEVDFPEVVQRKYAIIQKSPVLSQYVGKLNFSSKTNESVIFMMENNYCMIGCDMKRIALLQQLSKESGIDFSIPTMLISECAVTYMDESSSTELISWASSQFSNAVFATYEQVFPEDGFGIVMSEHFNILNTPLLSLKSFPDLVRQEQRYLAQNWTSCVSKSAFDMFVYVTDPSEWHRIFTIEPFDEFEELHLKCCHYTLTTAFRGSLMNLEDKFSRVPSASFSCKIEQLNGVVWTLTNGVTPELHRFSHDSCVVSNRVLIMGGFGVSNAGKHARQKTINFYQSTGSKVAQLEESGGASLTLDTVYHTLTPVPDSNKVVLFGGRTSPQTPVNVRHIVLTVTSDRLIESVLEEHEDEKSFIVSPPRWRHSAVSVLFPSNRDGARYVQCIAVFGGRNSELEVLRDLWILDIFNEESNVFKIEHKPEDTWPPARFSHSAATYKIHNMIVTGGIGEDLLPLDDVWCFDCKRNSWESLRVTMLPRYGHRSLVCGSWLLLIGGVNTLSGKHPGICLINMSTMSCVEYSLPAQDPERPILLHNHSVELFPDDDTITVFGGGGNCFSFGTAFNKNLVTVRVNQLLPKS